MLKTETRRQGSVTILTVTGDVHSADNDAFSRAVEQLKDQAGPGSRVAVDLAGLEYLNSRAMGDLVALYMHLRSLGGEAVLAGARPGVLKVLRFTGLGELLETFPDIAAATSALSARAGAEPK
jgi:stage II sporulation protein AA (anti-sigma F factor antagonist)